MKLALLIRLKDKLADTIGKCNKEKIAKLSKPFCYLFILYFVSLFTIIRANYYYIDDMARAVEGYQSWDTFSRYFSNYSSSVIHVNQSHLTDIAPLTQLIACAVLAIASMILVYTLKGKLDYLSLTASIPLGLSPWFLECMSYRFDSPYMALSILVQIVPFLFWRKKLAFAITSVLCLLAMCMLYQAGSGIFIIMTLAKLFLDWNNASETHKSILAHLGLSVLAYVAAWLLFHFVFQKPEVDTYVSQSIFPLQELFPGVIGNIKRFLKTVWNGSASVWKLLFAITIAACFVSNIVSSKRNRPAAFLVFVVFLALCSVFWIGAYMALSKIGTAPRFIYGFGGLISVVCVLSIPNLDEWSSKKHLIRALLAVPSLCLCYSLIVFAFMYGNALADQDRYIEARNINLITELNRLNPDEEEPITVKMNKGILGYSPIVKNIETDYPIITQLVPSFSDVDWVWSTWKLRNYYGMPIIINNEMDDTGWPTVADTYFYTIKGEGNNYSIIMKH